MGLVIKSNLKITNPKLGKLQTRRVITSCSLIRSIGDVAGSNTNAELGGEPVAWSGASVMEYVATGLANSINNTLGTVYLNTEAIKDFDITFELVAVTNGNVIFDLRRQTTNNRCVRFYLKSAGLQIKNRHSVGDVEIQPNIPIADGDKVNIRLVGSNVKVSINNKLVSNVMLSETAQTELDKTGLLALSKGDTTGVNNGQIVIKNLIVAEAT